jgi:signal transduction histidine kinase
MKLLPVGVAVFMSKISSLDLKRQGDSNRADEPQAYVDGVTDHFLKDNAKWIEAESIRSFMPTQQQTHAIALLVIPGIFLLLYGQANVWALSIWLAASMLLGIYRWRITADYVTHLRGASTEAQLQFLNQHRWTWPATSFLWGSLVWIFFTKAELFYQFACFVTIASVGVFSATSYAAHPKLMKLFINTLMVTLLSIMLVQFLSNKTAAIDSFFYPVVCLQLIFWKLLLLIGNRLNQLHLQSLQLHKSNEKLIASLKAQTSRANQAVATKNRLIASAAHDIRQPVLALEMYASMLKSDPDQVTVLTDKVCLATKSVINMFDSLFDLARIESSHINVNKTNVHLPELFRELDLQYQPAAQAKKLALRFRCKRLDIDTDHQLLKRILGNLMMNAIKFTEKGGVLLACKQTKQGLRFEVWDTGIGIPNDQQEAVFREFYKAPNHSGTSDGFGLGLSIVARLCESLNFKFSMLSRVGRGSMFCIELPCTSQNLKQ